MRGNTVATLPGSPQKELERQILKKGTSKYSKMSKYSAMPLCLDSIWSYLNYGEENMTSPAGRTHLKSGNQRKLDALSSRLAISRLAGGREEGLRIYFVTILYFREAGYRSAIPDLARV